MMGHWGEFGGWGMGFGFVFMLLFWGLIIAGLVALVRWLMHASQGGRDQQTRAPDRQTPLQILQERYARGEIDRQEYEQKRQDLEK